MNPPKRVFWIGGLILLGAIALNLALKPSESLQTGLLSTVAVVCLLASLWISLGFGDRRSTDAILRLDWFLPTLRRTRDQGEVSSSFLGRMLRRALPTSWQSDWMVKRRGPLRRMLRFLGISWLASPVRRIVQSVCLIAFCILFFFVCWPYDAQPIDDRNAGHWPSHYTDNLMAKEVIPAETFLMIDPLVSLSTAIASRQWVWSLASALGILIVCVLVPRGFCGYVCPLGTTIDLFDWLIGKRVQRFRVASEGWWVHIKYYLLAAILISAACGVLISGYFSAIPVLTRGMLFVVDPVQTVTVRGWHLVPSWNAGQWISIGMFASVLGLGVLRPRFWCKYVCPSGAVFSIANLFRATERKVESSCIHCNKCVEVCPFDAIKPDFTTRVTDCTMCQTCGGVCPTHAIKFVERGNRFELKVLNEPPTHETTIGRRGLLSLAAGGGIAVAGGVAATMANRTWGANLEDPKSPRPIRPPGSVPEREFLQMCIRCGECFKACPNNVLHPEGFLQGFEGLWTPYVNANWAGCESSCNACGQVCPTGAIRALALPEKKVARMGLAIVNPSTCLPLAGKEDCDLCVQECIAAGYSAIEYSHVGVQTSSSGQPIEGTGFLAPVVLADKCVGCGLCQTRCYAINVKEKGLLSESAIIIEAGPGKEDRLITGSYIELRQQEQQLRHSTEDARENRYFVPDDVPATKITNETTIPATDEDDPFGVGTGDDDPFGINE